MLQIRKSEEPELIMPIIQSAFPGEQGAEIAELARDLFNDPTARPLISLLAEQDGRPVGHILFTRVELTGEDRTSASILAPLAVNPEFQSQGIGGQLIREGLSRLVESGTELVFVLGHPGYYPRHGFAPVGVKGFNAPYPIPAKDANAWMVQELADGIIGRVHGTVQCADALMDPRYWRE